MEQRQRLHPLTPLVRSARLLVVVIAGLSWRGLADLGLAHWLIAMAAVAVFAAIGSAVSWAVTGYELAGRELRVYEGLISRRTRSIPLERVQTVDVVRPLVPRLLGLAELRLEVVGAKKTEAPLAYLSVADAAELRERLIALVSGTPVDAETPAEQPLHTVDNRMLVIGQLLTPQAWAVPIGLAFVLVQAFSDPLLTFIGIASTLTALIGVFQVPVRRILDDWNFRIAIDPTGLRLRHGLLSTRSQTVPPQRVQAVNVIWPLLWRPKGWRRARIDVAGYGAGAESIRAGVLLPVADDATTRRVAGMVLGGAVSNVDNAGIDIATLPMTPPPPRARWLSPIARPYLGFGLTNDVVAARSGVLTRELVVVPLARVQSVRVVQGPVQRWLGLASVHVDTAGALHVVAEHRESSEAAAIAATLATLSRTARKEGPPPNGFRGIGAPS